MVYKWNYDFGVDAQKAGERIEELSREGGDTAKKLVDDARPEGSLFHKCFDWNDQSAAEKYRLYTARRIIGSIQIVTDHKDSEDKPLTVRAFSMTDTQHEYKPTMTIIKHEDGRKMLLERAFAEFEEYRKKYQSLQELAKVFIAFDEAKNLEK